MHLMIFFIPETTQNKSVFPPERDADIQVKEKENIKNTV